MKQVTTIGLDIAKHVFQLHGADAAGHVLFRKRVTRTKLIGFLTAQTPCVVAMEACAGAHYWAREMAKLDLPRFRGEMRAWDQAIWLYVMLSSGSWQPAALMGPLLVVFGDPRIKVGLQLVDGVIDLLAERHPVELIQDGAMEALADPIGLRAFGLGAAVIDVLDREVELVSWLWVPQNSVPRSVSIRDRRMACSS